MKEDLKELLESAAEHFELAAKHYRAAADGVDEEDHDSATQHMCVAQGYTIHAHEYAARAFKRNVKLHDEEAESDEDEDEDQDEDKDAAIARARTRTKSNRR
jgi:hypothetical protein